MFEDSEYRTDNMSKNLSAEQQKELKKSEEAEQNVCVNFNSEIMEDVTTQHKQ